MMTDKTVFLTEEGLKKLEEELQYLETEKRAEVAARIQSAKEEGDISENAEYDDAKHEQAFVEGRSDEVRLGSHVSVLEEGLDEPELYHIVGSAEVDPLNGRVSNESPIGQALMGQRVGAVVSYQAPAGEIKLTILGID
jgi:transcription elongation factor GreA